MKNVKEAAKMISEEKNGAVIFADSDLDGVTSAIMLQKSIELIGGSACVYISDIENWGRGLTPKAVSAIEEESSLIITLDCGMSSFEGVEEAKKKGFKVIVIDHHEPLEKLPCADLIINPKQEGDSYPFKKMANAGVVLFFLEELLQEKFLLLRRKFMELTTIATVADMVPKEKDNKKILDEGLQLLENPQLPALRVLRRNIESDFVQKTTSLLNITERKGKVNYSYLFLSAEEESAAEEMLEDLFSARKERDDGIALAVNSVMQKVSEDSVIVFEEVDAPSHYCGTIASHVISRVKKPTFIYVTEGDVSRGSVRAPSDFNSVKAMSHCSSFLLNFGGHPPAAGFLLKKKDLNKFKNCLIDYLK